MVEETDSAREDADPPELCYGVALGAPRRRLGPLAVYKTLCAAW